MTELVAMRQAVLDSFGDNCSEADDLEKMPVLESVEGLFVSATYNSQADKLAGNAILNEVEPNSWDHFQCNHFKRMQQFS